VKKLVQPEYAMLGGAIAGRALYDGQLDPQEALTLVAAANRERQQAKG
jgi:phosphoribosylformimino-5-aminoimidazole carboxamide ribotide isomerase